MYKLDRHDLRTPQNRPKERFSTDLMYKEVVFVYAVELVKNSLGGQVNAWSNVAVPINASVQLEALNGQAVEHIVQPNRVAHLYTRKRNGMRWHDKVQFGNLVMRVEYVEDFIENHSGQFQYLYARAFLLTEADFVDGTPATNKVV